jgi:hypothetical protein
MPAEREASDAPDAAEIVRRWALDDGKHVRLTVRCGERVYHVLLSPARGMNGEVVGYRYQLAGRLQPSAEHAEAAAVSAIERISSLERPGPLPGVV